MARKRDYIAEIQSIKDRLPQGQHRFYLLSERLVSIANAGLYVQNKVKDKSLKEELYRYFPTALVACIQAYYKLAVEDLINHGEAFSKNAKKLRLMQTPLTVEDILNMEKKVTPAQLIAHLLNFNSMSDIDNHMTDLIGEGYLKKLKKTRFPEDPLKRTKLVTMEEYDKHAFLYLNALFAIRHVYCHEITEKPKFTANMLTGTIVNVWSFFMASNHLIGALLGEPLI